MRKKKYEVLGPIGFLIFGIWLLLIIPGNIPQAKLSSIGPRALPTFVAGAFILLSIVLLIEHLVDMKRSRVEALAQAETVEELNVEQQIPVASNNKKDVIRTILTVIMIFGYVLAFERVGYLISTFVLTTLLLVIFRVKKTMYFVAVYVANIAIYFAFTKLLYVLLP